MSLNQLNIKDFKDFENSSKYYGIEIDTTQLNLFKKYYEILKEWNKKINLISRKEGNILEKHFLDSIIFLPEIEIFIAHCSSLVTVFDIGSGGGFPAIPLAIMKPSWQFTLCESIKKKTGFLNELIKYLELKNVNVINARVETLHATSLHHHKYDLVTVRAVGKLDLLIKYSLPLLKKRGCLLAFKAKDIDNEIKNAQKLIEKNKLKLEIFSKEINYVERKLVVLH